MFLATSFFILLSGCANKKIIRDWEYEDTQAAFKGAEPERALQSFPQKEQHGFVTSIEKAWIGLWAQENKSEGLLAQAKTLDERRFTSVSREAEYFFYSESDDGYIPAEHEIIVMHLLSSMYFLETNQWNAARVEAKKAAFYLQNYFPEHQSHFDDPALRIWLAGIWAALGEWGDAEVDLRKAYELSKNKELLPLLELKQAPAEFSVIFSGTGPAVIWHPDKPLPQFSDQSKAPEFQIQFNTLPWFQRHEVRNSEIRDTVLKSNYMAQYYGLNTKIGATKTTGFVLSSLVRVTGVFLGAAIIAGGIGVAINGGANSAETASHLISGGALVGGSLWDSGGKISDHFDCTSKQIKNEGEEDLKTFRFVRFLPSWIAVSPETPILGALHKELIYAAPNSKTKVHFIQRFL